MEQKLLLSYAIFHVNFSLSKRNNFFFLSLILFNAQTSPSLFACFILGFKIHSNRIDLKKDVCNTSPRAQKREHLNKPLRSWWPPLN